MATLRGSSIADARASPADGGAPLSGAPREPAVAGDPPRPRGQARRREAPSRRRRYGRVRPRSTADLRGDPRGVPTGRPVEAPPLLPPSTVWSFRAGADRSSRSRHARSSPGSSPTPGTSIRGLYVTETLAAGVDAGIVSRQAGHARADFTRDVYQRVRREDARAAADAIDAGLGSAFDVASVDLPLTSEGGDVVELRPKGR